MIWKHTCMHTDSVPALDKGPSTPNSHSYTSSHAHHRTLRSTQPCQLIGATVSPLFITYQCFLSWRSSASTSICWTMEVEGWNTQLCFWYISTHMGQSCFFHIYLVLFPSKRYCGNLATLWSTTLALAFLAASKCSAHTPKELHWKLPNWGYIW